MELKTTVLAVTLLCVALLHGVSSQKPAAPAMADTPAPAPAPRHVDLADLLSLAGPYSTFLGYLTKTGAITTLQSLANDTTVNAQGVTVFAPEDSAFVAVHGAALSNLTADGLRTLMLCHAAPRYYPLSSFSALAASGGPVPTLAGGERYAVNVTDAAGKIRVASGWATARLVSSVYSTSPVAVYALDRVLLPEGIFPTAPEVAPVPAPAPAPARADKASDGAPGAAGHRSTGDKSLSCRVGAGRLLAVLAVMFITMNFTVAFLTTNALSLTLLLAGGALASRPPPSPVRTNAGGGAAPAPQDKGGNLTDVLTIVGPFTTFLMYLRQTNLVAVFEHQAYHTDQGITIFVPVDQAFAAIEPSVLPRLNRNQMRHLMMYHTLGRHYAAGEFEGLCQSNPVTTLAGNAYAVNVTYDGGVAHVTSRWADARVVGCVYETAAMAVYELDRVLLPDVLFRVHPPVADTPPVPPLLGPPAGGGGGGGSGGVDPPPDDDYFPSYDHASPPPAPSAAGTGNAEGSAAADRASSSCYAVAVAVAVMTLMV
uniref:FAS1 domain-containing protein n=1 Tax=Leersia perrieri TaxID=77586 RepID=A0A0D9W649_9ORYZ